MNEQRIKARKKSGFEIWDFIRSNNHLITLVTLMFISAIITGGIFFNCKILPY